MLSVAAVTSSKLKTASAERDRILLTHTALVALTPLIPLPFVDTMAQSRLQRRMVRLLAQGNDLLLQPAELARLADDQPGSAVEGIVKGLVLTPLRGMLSKVFIVLAGHKIAEVASTCYHRGFLADRAFARGLCAPDGPYSASAIREAIDEVMAAVPMASSPVTAALRAGLSRSRVGLARLSKSLRARIATLRSKPAEAEVEQAVDDATADGDASLDGIVAQLRRALNEVPAKHFDDLERSLCQKLGSCG